MHLLASDQYRTSYVTMRELVDHYFPPVGLLVKEGGEEYTDFNYWRDRPLEIDEFSASESGSDYEEDEYDHDADADGRPSIEASLHETEDLEASFYSRASLESAIPGMEESFDPSMESSILEEDEHDQDMLSFPPETPFDERIHELGAGEVEVDDPTNKLGALDLAAEATPHVQPADERVGLGPVEELTRVLSSPESGAKGRGRSAQI